MAPGGQIVSCYVVSVKDGWLDVSPRTMADKLTVTVTQAVETIKAGGTANLLASDIVEFYSAAEEAGLKVRPADAEHPLDGVPQVDFTPAADPHIQQLVADNARLTKERDEWEALAMAAEKQLPT